jgi:hypothetical protein
VPLGMADRQLGRLLGCTRAFVSGGGGDLRRRWTEFRNAAKQAAAALELLASANCFASARSRLAEASVPALASSCSHWSGSGLTNLKSIWSGSTRRPSQFIKHHTTCLRSTPHSS